MVFNELHSRNIRWIYGEVLISLTKPTLCLHSFLGILTYIAETLVYLGMILAVIRILSKYNSCICSILRGSEIM